MLYMKTYAKLCDKVLPFCHLLYGTTGNIGNGPNDYHQRLPVGR